MQQDVKICHDFITGMLDRHCDWMVPDPHL